MKIFFLACTLLCAEACDLTDKAFLTSPVALASTSFTPRETSWDGSPYKGNESPIPTPAKPYDHSLLISPPILGGEPAQTTSDEEIAKISGGHIPPTTHPHGINKNELVPFKGRTPPPVRVEIKIVNGIPTRTTYIPLRAPRGWHAENNPTLTGQ